MFTYRTCGQRHHSMLHFNKTTVITAADVNINTQSISNSSASVMTTCLACCPQHRTVLLATALVEAKASNGTHYIMRALIDRGSEASFIMTRCVNKL